MKIDIDYMLSVMQAYKEGKTIENKAKYTSHAWSVDHNPVWNWDYIDYRVKAEENEPPYLPTAVIDEGIEIDYRVKEEEKEPSHRPYEDKNEFLVDSINNRFYLCDKNTNTRFLPTCVLANGVEMTCNGECISLTWKKLFENFTWNNGSPCGTKK